MTAVYDFTDKIVLVTGGTSGIGLATAKAFVSAGANVVVSSRSTANGSEAVSMLSQHGRASFVQADVSDDASVIAMVKHCVDMHGRIDVAFNNAGAEPDESSSLLEDSTEENWQAVVDTHLSGVYRCLKCEVKAMLGTGGGAIINMSSVYGLGADSVAFPSYVASKHGVVGLTKSAAVQYAKKNIRVNVVCPGVIKTDMLDRTIQANPEMEKFFAKKHPMGRLGSVQEVADAVLWLASDRAAFVTGHALAVDGGMGAGV